MIITPEKSEFLNKLNGNVKHIFYSNEKAFLILD